jgi:GNAT superfamily N-acetyltransferase
MTAGHATRFGTVSVQTYAGSALADVLPAVADLRIIVFRDWPYLYEGTRGYESRYLAKFAAAPDAVIVVARDGDAIIGTATAGPLMQHVPEFADRFTAKGYDPARAFYFGESVLLSAYRGRGLGHAFFDHREAAARAAQSSAGGYTHAAFCGVVRPSSHPARPPEYVPLDAFWTKRGYAKVDGLTGSFAWTDIGETAETDKPMQFWARAL